MLCQSCCKHKATILFTQIVGQAKTVHHLCEDCANEKKGADGSGVQVILNQELVEKAREQACPSCGETLAEFEKSGLLGCPMCYESFEPEVERLLKRIHGVSRHCLDAEETAPVTGIDDIAHLEDRLQEAVAKEEFEEAGQLRDQISKLKLQVGDS